MLRIGMLTSGGDCQALNAAMRGVAKVLYNGDSDTWWNDSGNIQTTVQVNESTG